MLKQNKLDVGIKLIENPILDKLTRTPVWLPIVLWGGVSVANIVMGIWLGTPWYHALWMIGVGFILWTFAEYSVHRWFFHFTPKSEKLRELMYSVHEHHHHYQERDRILTPPLLSTPIFVFFVGVFYLAIGLPFGVPSMLLTLGGFGIGYLLYDYVHFYTHFGRPRSRLGKFLRRCHLHHHFVQADRWYCISFPWIDYLFGTHLPMKQVGQSREKKVESASESRPKAEAA